MEETHKQFTTRLSEFSEMLRDIHSQHASHILKLGNMHKEIMLNQKTMLAQLKLETEENPKTENPTFKETLNTFLSDCISFDETVKTFRKTFQQQIDDTNFALGSFSGLWGGYIENIGVQYMLNCLRKDCDVHTWFQKYKRYWDKNHNVEIDLLALSDTHAYIVEVKNQLKPETFTQMITVLDKIESKIPEYKNLKKQPIIVCMHAEEQIVKAAVSGNVWILRYKGFDRDKPQNSFEWLMREDIE